MTDLPRSPAKRPRRQHKVEAFPVEQMLALFRKAAISDIPLVLTLPDPAKARRTMFLLQAFRKSYRDAEREDWQTIERVRLSLTENRITMLPVDPLLQLIFDQAGVAEEPFVMTPEEFDRLGTAVAPLPPFDMSTFFGAPSDEPPPTSEAPAGEDPLSDLPEIPQVRKEK